jgi:hypothetical protein
MLTGGATSPSRGPGIGLSPSRSTVVIVLAKCSNVKVQRDSEYVCVYVYGVFAVKGSICTGTCTPPGMNSNAWYYQCSCSWQYGGR